MRKSLIEETRVYLDVRVILSLLYRAGHTSLLKQQLVTFRGPASARPLTAPKSHTRLSLRKPTSGVRRSAISRYRHAARATRHRVTLIPRVSRMVRARARACHPRTFDVFRRATCVVFGTGRADIGETTSHPFIPQ